MAVPCTLLLCLVILTNFLAPANSACSHRSPELRLKFGRFEVSSSKVYNRHDVVVAKCRQGYVLKGDKILICDGKNWKTRTRKVRARCLEPKCPEPPNIVNGYVVYGKRHTPRSGGSKAYYKCLKGYKTNGNITFLYCKKRDKSWKGTAPKCIAKKKCNDTGELPFGQRKLRGNLEEGSEITFQCDEGNNLIGAPVIKCLSTGKWNHDTPYCKPNISCNVPTSQEVPNVRVFIRNPGDKYVVPGEFLYLECEKGFNMKGISFIECLENGTWDSDFAKCEAVSGCNPITQIENGTVVGTLQFHKTMKVGAVLNFYCNHTFRLNGPSWVECIHSEFKGVAWSAEPPKCERITCSDHEPPENGIKSSNGPFYVGAVVQYSCYKGYTLIGSKNRTCQETGMWSGALTTCDSKTSLCPNPGVPINGFKLGNNYNVDDAVIYSCKHGHLLDGNATRICQRNGYWSGTEVFCRGPNEFDDVTRAGTMILKKVDTLKLISEKTANLTDRSNGTSRNVSGSNSRTLDINHAGGLNLVFIFDSSGSIGNTSFDTAKKFSIVLVRHLGIKPDGVRVAAISFSSKAEVNFHTSEHLTTEEVVEKLQSIQYKGGDTATNDALKKAREEVISNFVRERPTSKTAIFLITDGHANWRGSPSKEAKLIVDEFDVEIYAIGVGRDISKKELASIAHPKFADDKHYMIIESFAKLDELLQFIISGGIDYSACGLQHRRETKKNNENSKADARLRKKRSYRMRIIGGEDVSNYWPWMVALYHKSKGKDRLKCGASLITRNWLLTAAHCLIHKDSNNKIKIYSTGKVRAHLGMTDFNNPNKSHIIEATLDRFLLHPDYDAETLNNDIALIHLRDPIAYNALIRPVCLPPAVDKLPKDSSFYKSNEEAIVTGWGHTKVRKKNEKLSFSDLKQSAELQKLLITIRDDKTCNNSLKGESGAYPYSYSMFCAGSDEAGKDSCSTDSGGPLHQRLEDSDGDGTYYTQIGIVSWGMGCGIKGEYGFYTNVAKFIPWIENQTNTNFS